MKKKVLIYMTKFYIALDTETGGIGLDKSLLTAHFIFFTLKNDNTLNIFDELNLKIKPNDGVYKVTGEALAINGINLAEHDKVAITEKEAGTQLYNKLRTLKVGGFTDKSNIESKYIPVGHNLAGDILHIKDKLISAGSWENFVSYRSIDTCSIAQFLRTTGHLPDAISCSLVELTKHFNIQVDGDAHNEIYDTYCTLYLFQCMKMLLANEKG